MKNILPPLINSKLDLVGIPSGTVYHYTNLNGFKGIIDSGEFHLSNYQDLNLKGNYELVWAYELYIQTVRHLFPNSFDFSALLPASYFVFCTCVRQNNRYLWDYYGSENAGDHSGIVLGISANAFYQHYSYQNKVIDMMPMEYNPEGFLRLCKKSVEGLKPIVFEPIQLLKPLSEYTIDERTAMLRRFSGYDEYAERRSEPIGVLTFQKKEDFAKEEEIRILNWQDLHIPLQQKNIRGKLKAVLPWRLTNGHFIKQIIRTERCGLSESEIQDYLNHKDIEAEIQTMNAKELA